MGAGGGGDGGGGGGAGSEEEEEWAVDAKVERRGLGWRTGGSRGGPAARSGDGSLSEAPTGFADAVDGTAKAGIGGDAAGDGGSWEGEGDAGVDEETEGRLVERCDFVRGGRARDVEGKGGGRGGVGRFATAADFDFENERGGKSEGRFGVGEGR